MIFSPTSQTISLPQNCTSKVIDEKECLFFSSFEAPRLISFSHHLNLLVRKVFFNEMEHRAEALLVFQNGKPIQINAQFRYLFDQQLSKSERIDYSVKFQKQYFHIVLTFTLDVKDSNFMINETDIKETICILKKVQNLLLFGGFLKTKNRLSLETLKQGLFLKKQIAQSLSPISKNKIQNPTQSQPKTKLIQRLSIKQISTTQQKQNKKGTNFLVQKKTCNITHPNGTVSQAFLAKKRIRGSKDQQTKRKAKLLRELQIIGKINNNQYFLKYYLAEEEQSCFYMEYIPTNLKDIIYDKKVQVNQRFLLANQLIQAVSILHTSNIVHRDLKPENILVETVDLIQKLKIIDFGESSLIEGAQNSQFNLGCSPPYSPVQCLMDIENESYNKPEIDLWSIVMIIYQLMFRSLPVYYNRSIQSEIVNGWRNQGDFSVILCHRKRSGFHKIQEMINLFVEQGLKIEQKQRLSLSSMKCFMKSIEEFHRNLQKLTKSL